MHEPRFKNSLGDDADAWRYGHQRHHLRLSVRGETGVGQRGDVHGFEPAIASNRDTGPMAFDSRPGIGQLVEHRVHLLGTRAAKSHGPIGRSGGNRISGRFDPIGNHFVFGPVEFFHACYGDRGAAHAGNLRAHCVQKIGEVHHLRLAGGAFDDSNTFREHSGHHHIGRPQHR